MLICILLFDKMFIQLCKVENTNVHLHFCKYKMEIPESPDPGFKFKFKFRGAARGELLHTMYIDIHFYNTFMK